MPQSLINVINLPKEYFLQSKITHFQIFTLTHLENKLAEDRVNPPKEDEYCDFMNLFGHLPANRLRPPQMSLFVLPNANPQYLIN